MRYLVRARVKPGRERALLEAIENRTLGRGSVAGDEYFRNMQKAKLTCVFIKALAAKGSL